VTGLVPSYPQPYRLYNPASGHALYSGPNGEGGYAGPVLNSLSWVQPDGVRVWYHPNDTIDQSNRVALGYESIWVGDGAIGYAGAYAAAQRQGANADQADIAAAISMAESIGGHWSAHNNTAATGDDSIGLWQINLRAHANYRATNLYNIDANAAAMRDLSGTFTNWSAWSTYRSGAFRQYLRGAGQPVTSGPHPGPVPQSTEGPVERLVDGLVGHIPNVPLIGGAIRDGVKAVLHPIAAAVDAGIAFVVAGVEEAKRLAQGLVTDALTTAAGWVVDAENYVRRRFNEAFAYIGGLIADAIHAAESFAVFIVRGVETIARDLVNALRVSLSAAFEFGIGALRAVIDGVHAALSAAFEFGIGALRAVIDGLHAALNEGLKEVENLARDLVGGVEAALHVFIRDVFGPLEREVRHWIDDVLGPVEWLWRAAVKLERWIVWLADTGVDDATEAVGFVRSATVAELGDAVRVNVAADIDELVSIIHGQAS
jgi:hypothetical protein